MCESQVVSFFFNKIAHQGGSAHNCLTRLNLEDRAVMMKYGTWRKTSTTQESAMYLNPGGWPAARSVAAVAAAEPRNDG